MKTALDDCLLCRHNKADKKNSHIIPSFMTKSMLRQEGKSRGYIINTQTTHLPLQVVQDTYKEDHILCSECENYFAVLEAIFANNIHRKIRDVRFQDNFSTYINEEEVRVIGVLNSIPITIYLLIYSIVWRCHISTGAMTENLKLSNENAETLRCELLKFKSIKKDDLLILVHNLSKNFAFIPFSLITSKTFKDLTGNFIDVRTQETDGVKIMASEYLISLNFRNHDQSSLFYNETDDKIKITLLSEELWNGLVASLVEEMKKISEINLTRQGQIFYGLKNATD